VKGSVARWESVIREVILHADAGGCEDAEIHAILKDGTQIVYHFRDPNDKALAILKDSIGKYFKLEVDRLEHTRP
jgi:hypothetical protein